MSGSLDTNILLRLIVGDVAAQTAAADGLIDITPSSLAVADAVFIELEYALRAHYSLDRREVAIALIEVATNPKINCNKLLIQNAMSMYVDHPALSFTDICLAAYARISNHLPLHTFDKKLAIQHQDAELLTI